MLILWNALNGPTIWANSLPALPTTMGVAMCEKWRCRTCRSSESQSGSSSASQDDGSVFLSQLTSLNEKTDFLRAIQESIETLFHQSLPPKVDELMVLKSTLKGLQSTVDEAQSAVGFLSTKYDTFLMMVSENSRRMKELEAESAVLRGTVSEEFFSILKLQGEANKVEQCSRLSSFGISGLPVSPNKNLPRRMCDLAENLVLTEFLATNISAVDRLLSKPSATAVILVWFASVRAKNKWFGALTRLRCLSETTTIAKLFF